MKIIEVIPISRGFLKDTLSYFSSADVKVGSIVKVPLRKKTIPALVVRASEVSESKTDIKNMSFTLKKAEKLKAFDFIDENFIRACEETAKYFCARTGAVLCSLIPNLLFENAEKLNIPEATDTKIKMSGEKHVVQAEDDERYANYKSLIREEFAKNMSVFFCLPTIQGIKQAVDRVQKGIEQYTYTLHSSMSKKEAITTINKILAEKHPVVIVATASFLSINRKDVGTIIVDRENSRSYKTMTRPNIDLRYFIEIYAEIAKKKIVFGDLLLRTETVARYQTGELLEISPLKFRSLSTARQEIIDARKLKEEDEKKIVFKVISPRLEEIIHKNIENNEHMFIFSSRRGLSPSVICADCGTVVRCNTCGAHTVLHKSSIENFFLCHKCGERRSALEKCKKCTGWKLITLGIGSELVETELQKIIPDAKIFRIDSDNTPTHRKATQIIEKFYASPQGILVGTEMALLYLSEKIDNSAVISMDSFFSIPDFRINEKILNILLKMRSITDRNFAIQTRDPEQKIFDYAIKGNLIDFYKEEIRDRKDFNYPPFSTIIKINISGTKDQVVESVERVQKLIDPFEIDVFPAFIPFEKGKYCVNGIIRVKSADWPNEKLQIALLNIPKEFNVTVDPESLL